MIIYYPLDPLQTEMLIDKAAQELMRQSLQPLSELVPFSGMGVYILCYQGSLPTYQKITHKKIPIYTGKAEKKLDRPQCLFVRLTSHIRTLVETGFPLEDFSFSCLEVPEDWVVFMETAFIKKFKPVWNDVLTGFGTIRVRSIEPRPRFDTVHSGRECMMKCKERKETAEQLLAEVEAHFKTYV